jgi:hypothetical protein
VCVSCAEGGFANGFAAVLHTVFRQFKIA